MVGPGPRTGDSPSGPRPGRWIALAALALAGCATLPPIQPREATRSLTDTGATTLARQIDPLAARYPGKTGVHILESGTDAFAARVVLARAAERSIDAQYYIWHPDQSGLLLLEELTKAAARGVRVRLLVDDQNTAGMDAMLATLAARPGLEVRLYNPFANRGSRMLDYLGDFSRVNRRMHNKAFISDGRLAVIGGRNVANEYFHAGSQEPVIDLDLVAMGAAVGEIATQFDLYWNSASAYPVPTLVGAPAPGADAELARRFAESGADPVTKAYVAAVRETPLLAHLKARSLPLEWTEARLVYDDPAKTLDTTERRDVLLTSRLLEGAAQPRASFDIVSPYFAPGERGTALLTGLARSGIRVRILTNSLAATDFTVVFSGYSKRRCELARAGVRLYELKPSIAGSGPKGKPGSSTDTSLHAKTYSVDDERIFVGSFNFDLRSALLNTEMGLVMRSPALAGRLTAAIDAIPANAYEVRPRTEGACVEWIERTAAGEVRHETEPLSSGGRRAWLDVLEALPLDWML